LSSDQMPTDPLPTDEQRVALCEMLSFALVEIRHLAWSGEANRAGELADVFHELPRQMHGWDEFSWDQLRESIDSYQDRYKDQFSIYNFRSLLDRVSLDSARVDNGNGHSS